MTIKMETDFRDTYHVNGGKHFRRTEYDNMATARYFGLMNQSRDMSRL